MPMITMVSLEYDDEDKTDFAPPLPMPSKPDYPPGLCICLTSKEIEKLGIDPTDARVDGRCMIQAICCVKHVSNDKTEDGDCWRIELQIEDMGILGSDEGDGESLAA